MLFDRRHFIGATIAAIGAFMGRALAMTPRRGRARSIRPPGALPESEFLASCIRCYKCVEICPNACIEVVDLQEGFAELGTPYIEPRSRGCIGCMKCTTVCPTGALQPQSAEHVPGVVKMGLARLNKDMCYSWAEPARTCGVCYRACPWPGKAMTIGMFERPEVNPDLCVGCGLCEQSCIHLPQAIRIVPVDRDESREEA